LVAKSSGRRFGRLRFTWGAFGENFTSEGILEDQIKIGDRIRIGSAEFMVTSRRFVVAAAVSAATSGERTPLACWFRRLAETNLKSD
jgi:uncharacterized metal-binding protein